jgi:hypothetical protein
MIAVELQLEEVAIVPGFAVLVTVETWFTQMVSGFAVNPAVGGVLIRMGATVASEFPHGFVAMSVTPKALAFDPKVSPHELPLKVWVTVAGGGWLNDCVGLPSPKSIT